MTPPPWFTPDCHTALAECIANPPREYVRSADDWRHDASMVFTCKGHPAFAKLRRAYHDWLDAEYALRDAAFKLTGVWEGDFAKVETADDLLLRAIAEPRKAAA